MKIIELAEYTPALISHDTISDAIGEKLWRNYNAQVAVEFPSPKTSSQWRLTSQGWVGNIPLTSEFHLSLRPKVKISNLFKMLEYAYHLKSFHFLDGLIDCQSLEDFYSHLAYVLAQLILERGRKGLYRDYLPKTSLLSYVRGRLDVKQAIQKPWDIKLTCHYEEHTVNVEANQILAWTLFIIGCNGLCSERVTPKVRQAYHSLQGCVTLKSHNPEDCVGQRYNRLNEDYRPLHALCRFFLENSGPSHERGDRTMLPFLVDMAHLYQLFVAEWLKTHLPSGLVLKQQHSVTIDGNRHFRIDLTLYDVETGTVFCVLDTKYKAPDRAADTDIHQMVSYATATKCKEAVLIYPRRLNQLLDVRVNDIQIRSLDFSLDGDLEQAGKTFLLTLLPSYPIGDSS